MKNIVSLVSFSVPEGKTKEEAKADYYKKISENGKACVVKIIVIHWLVFWLICDLVAVIVKKSRKKSENGENTTIF